MYKFISSFTFLAIFLEIQRVVLASYSCGFIMFFLLSLPDAGSPLESYGKDMGHERMVEKWVSGSDIVYLHGELVSMIMYLAIYLPLAFRLVEYC